MSEALWDPEMAMILGAQHNSRPLAEGRRATADVYRHVEHFALQHADQLALRIWPLVVEAAQHAASGAGYVGLHEVAMNARLAELRLVVALVEKATVVPEHLWLNHQHTRQTGRDHLHLACPSFASLHRYWP
jgi:hypothetical protein